MFAWAGQDAGLASRPPWPPPGAGDVAGEGRRLRGGTRPEGGYGGKFSVTVVKDRRKEKGLSSFTITGARFYPETE